jgi:hypothetical protein
MKVAVDELGLAESDADELWSYLVMAAHSLVNTIDDVNANATSSGLGVVSTEGVVRPEA